MQLLRRDAQAVTTTGALLHACHDSLQRNRGLIDDMNRQLDSVLRPEPSPAGTDGGAARVAVLAAAAAVMEGAEEEEEGETLHVCSSHVPLAAGFYRRVPGWFVNSLPVWSRVTFTLRGGVQQPPHPAAYLYATSVGTWMFWVDDVPAATAEAERRFPSAAARQKARARVAAATEGNQGFVQSRKHRMQPPTSRQLEWRVYCGEEAGRRWLALLPRGCEAGGAGTAAATAAAAAEDSPFEVSTAPDDVLRRYPRCVALAVECDERRALLHHAANHRRGGNGSVRRTGYRVLHAGERDDGGEEEEAGAGHLPHPYAPATVGGGDESPWGGLSARQSERSYADDDSDSASTQPQRRRYGREEEQQAPPEAMRTFLLVRGRDAAVGAAVNGLPYYHLGTCVLHSTYDHRWLLEPSQASSTLYPVVSEPHGMMPPTHASIRWKAWRQLCGPTGPYEWVRDNTIRFVAEG